MAGPFGGDAVSKMLDKGRMAYRIDLGICSIEHALSIIFWNGYPTSAAFYDVHTGNIGARIPLCQHLNPYPLGQVRGDWLCRELMPWGDGILECWNIGFGGIRSVFIWMAWSRK